MEDVFSQLSAVENAVKSVSSATANDLVERVKEAVLVLLYQRKGSLAEEADRCQSWHGDLNKDDDDDTSRETEE